MNTTATALTTSEQASPQIEKKRAPRALAPTGRIRKAIDAMVHQGIIRKKAASLAGINEKSLYNALCKPHVKQYYNQQLEVLRTSARARNFHRLEEIREQRKNPMASVNAIKTLEQMDADPALAGGSQRSAGLVIVIQASPQGAAVIGNATVIDAKPLNAKDDVHDGE